MTSFGSELLPEDFFAEVVGDEAITAHDRNSELLEARAIAEAHPRRWVRVGEERPLTKAPSSWCSEVNKPPPGREKRALLNRGGIFKACHWISNDDDGKSSRRIYGKAIMFIPDEVV